MITNFEQFLEAKIEDIFKLNKNILNKDISDDILSYQDSKNDFSKNLVQYITLNKRFNNKKIRLNLIYNNYLDHEIKDSIKNRSSIKTSEEFNILLNKCFNYILPKEFDENLKTAGNYCIQIKKEEPISILFTISLASLNDGYCNVKITTFINGVDFVNDVIYTFDIPENIL